ncbi:hypothetical protein [Vibrio sp. dhg]|uniref:hypothetical protein n=1 Tax=Vibrio sp. dhg TaxID=2163016 RepID=UPI000E507E0B|nr:hypothetical protein [Vibrio sp. dhg]AXT73747.1 hypothetical protein DBX26_22775 [Vibrio sp. dhg]
MSDIANAINSLAEPRLIDWATLIVAAASLIVACFAAKFSLEQKQISSRAERAKVLEDLFDILHILKHYDGENIDSDLLDKTFKRLQKIKLTSTELFSEEATEFVTEVMEKMHAMGTKSALYKNGIPNLFFQIIESSGIEVELPNLEEKNRTVYNEYRYFFFKGAFDKFQKLFAEYA